MVIFHSYVSLPEGKRALFFGFCSPSHCVKLSVPEMVEHHPAVSTAPHSGPHEPP